MSRRTLAMEVTCPRCKSAPGQRCTIRYDGETVHMFTPCEERIDAAKAASGPRPDTEQQVATRIAAWLERNPKRISDGDEALADAAEQLRAGTWKE